MGGFSEYKGNFDHNASPLGLHLQARTLQQFLHARIVIEWIVCHWEREVKAVDYKVPFAVHFDNSRKFYIFQRRQFGEVQFIHDTHQQKRVRENITGEEES